MLKFLQKALNFRIPTSIPAMYFSSTQSAYPEDFNLSPKDFVDFVQQAPAETEFPFVVLDVRESFELKLANLPAKNKNNAEIPKFHIPLGTVMRNGDLVSELPEDKYIVCLCHHGVRSMYAARHLQQAGFKTQNLETGIEGISNVWKEVPKYL